MHTFVAISTVIDVQDDDDDDDDDDDEDDDEDDVSMAMTSQFH